MTAIVGESFGFAALAGNHIDVLGRMIEVPQVIKAINVPGDTVGFLRIWRFGHPPGSEGNIFAVRGPDRPASDALFQIR